MVGARYRGKEAVELLQQTAHNEQLIVFEKEKFNRYDANAQKAYAFDRNGYLAHVGYMKREDAAYVNRQVSAAEEFKYLVCEFERTEDLVVGYDDAMVGKVKPIAFMLPSELDDYAREYVIPYL